MSSDPTDPTDFGIPEDIEKRALAFRYMAETGLHPDQVAPIPLPPCQTANIVPFPRPKKDIPHDD